MKPLVYLPVIMSSICLTVAINEFLVKVTMKGRKYSIAFGFVCVGGFLYNIASAGVYDSETVAGFLFWTKCQAVVLLLNAGCLLWFLSGRTGEVNKFQLIAFLLPLLLGALIQAIGFGDFTWVESSARYVDIHLLFGSRFSYMKADPGPFSLGMRIFGLVFFIYLFVRLRNFLRRNPKDGRAIYISLGFIFLAYLNDLAIRLDLYNFLYFEEHSWLIGVVLMGAKRSKVIAEAAMAKERLIASLEEKDILLKEVHHRVKNNLQLISSLLYLQGSRLEDENGKTVIRDCKDQVHSMALIHEDLYRSSDFRSVDFGNYLKSLMSRLLANYGMPSGANIVFDSDELRLEMELAIPCGLIANELFVNTLRHAFPPSAGIQSPEIRIGIGQSKPGKAFLSVRDNGIGFPDNFDPRVVDSFGMKLVTKLSDQIGGNLLVEYGRGAGFLLEFPIQRL